MAGICLDALNPVGHPTSRRLRNVHATAIRAELRAGDEYSAYINSLDSKIQNYLLIGPSTERPASVPLSTIPTPAVIIIGNEPDNEGPSSWTMTPDEYIQLWNTTAPQIRIIYPNIKLCTAGMLMPALDYLAYCWPRLQPTPDIVNKHYPNNEQEIQQFQQEFGVPVIVGEWCWKTATQDEMTDWIAMLSNNCLEHFWFCWSDGMVDGMGLTNKADRPTAAYRRYKKAIETLS